MSASVIRQFEDELKRLEREKNLKTLLLGGIDEEETPNPTLEDLRAIRKMFVTVEAIKEIEALSKKLGLVGRDGPDDPICMTTTRHSWEYYDIFKSANNKMKRSYNKRKHKECMNRLLAMILGLRDYQGGFGDTESPEDAQRILNKTCIVWRDMMKLDANTIGIEEDGKRVLFEVMNDLKEEMEELEYTMDIGVYRRPRMRRNHNENDSDDESDDDDDEDGNDSNHNRRKRRRRPRPRRRSSADDDDDDDDEDDDEPPRRRQRVQNVADEFEDDEVEAYQMSELTGKKVKDLKELLRDQHFPVSGNKQTLIDRLLYPKKAILEMKKGYHKRQCANRHVWVHQGTSQREVNAMIRRANVFKASNYVFKNGKITHPIRWQGL